jgi:diadenylate cyclase
MDKRIIQSESDESGRFAIQAQGSKSSGSNKKSTKQEQQQIRQLNIAIINHAIKIAKEISAVAILAYVEKIQFEEHLQALIKERGYILATQTDEMIDELKTLGASRNRILRIPHMNMTRGSQIKVMAVLALSKGLIRRNKRIICLSGPPHSGVYDSITALDVGREFEIFSSSAIDIGTIFVLGDHKKAMDMSSQMAINPFAKVSDNLRNIMDSGFKETLREFSTMDGAFVIRDDGVVLAAARHLNVSAETDDLPQGLAARHRAAAGITALTKAIAFVISESTGTVRIFSQGRIFMEIEKRK